MVYRLLTKRQAEYLRYRCAVASDREAAGAMGIAVETARALRAGVRTRLGGHTIDEICRMAEAGVSPTALFERPATGLPVAERARAHAKAERTRLAMALRRSGMTYRRIGRRPGVDDAGAHHVVKVGVAAWFRRAGMPVPPDKTLDELLALIPHDEGGHDGGCPDQAGPDPRSTDA